MVTNLPDRQIRAYNVLSERILAVTHCFEHPGVVILTQWGVIKVSVIEGRSDDETPGPKFKCSRKKKKKKKRPEY